MTIVSADGQDVKPVKKDRVLIGVAETYDVLVRPPGPGAYELRATAQDGSAWTSIWIGDGERHPAPDVPRANLYNAMGKLKPSNIFALTPGGTMGMPTREVNAGKFDKPGVMGGMMTMEEMMGMKMKPDMTMDGNGSRHADGRRDEDGQRHEHGRDGDGPRRHGADHGQSANPHYGKKHTWDFAPLGPDVSSRQPLVMDGMGPRPGPPYKDLRAVKNTALPAKNPVREVRLTLDGDMERYVWSLNNTPLFASDAIKIERGENVRFIMINRTMMHHPMHLHGHFFRVVNGQGDHAPLKHTVDVPPMQTTVIEFAADEVGDWFFHCHLLYHMMSGMARVVHYERLLALPRHRRRPPQALPRSVLLLGHRGRADEHDAGLRGAFQHAEHLQPRMGSRLGQRARHRVGNDLPLRALLQPLLPPHRRREHRRHAHDRSVRLRRRKQPRRLRPHV